MKRVKIKFLITIFKISLFCKIYYFTINVKRTEDIYMIECCLFINWYPLIDLYGVRSILIGQVCSSAGHFITLEHNSAY